jgi:hypothetical protein
VAPLPVIKSGDELCHRACSDGLCALGEHCESRLVGADDTGSMYLSMCFCDDASCPIRDPDGLPRPAEGGIQQWRAETRLPLDLYYHAAAADDRTMIVSGGLTITEIRQDGGGGSLRFVADVYTASIAADGKLSEWCLAGALPTPLIHHAMAIAAGRVYVAGGELESKFEDTVYSASLDATGSLGSWRVETALPAPRAQHVLAVAGNRLIVAGGTGDKNNTTGTDEIWVAALADDGSVGTWSTIKAPGPVHSDHGAGVADEALFVMSESGEVYETRSLGTAIPAWQTAVAQWYASYMPVHLLGLCDALLGLRGDGQALTAPIAADGALGEWRIASHIYGAASGGYATAVTPSGHAYLLGGFSGTPIQRVAEVWSTRRY